MYSSISYLKVSIIMDHLLKMGVSKNLLSSPDVKYHITRLISHGAVINDFYEAMSIALKMRKIFFITVPYLCAIIEKTKLRAVA